MNSGRAPNILFLFTDQQRADTIGAWGNSQIRTPMLDQLAREGTSFTRCYTPSPVCVSARCSLVTGLPPHRTGCVDNMPMPQHMPSFMEHLCDQGYQTHGVGKMHFTPDHLRRWGFESRDVSEEGLSHGDDYARFVQQAGYDHVTDVNGVRSEYYYIPQPSQLPHRLYNSTWVADRAVSFLWRRDRSRPFFLWASFIKPHPPFETPVPWNRLYRCAEMAPPFRPDGFSHLLNYWNRVQNRYKYCDGGYNERLARTIRAAYYASISLIDYHVGRILQALGSEIDNTLIVFSSDHGELLGDYGSYGKRCMLEAAARVPLLVRWPGHMDAGRIYDAPTSLLDLYPTFLTAAGIATAPDQTPGHDLVSLVRGAASRGAVFSQFQQGRYALYLAAWAQWRYIYAASDCREWLFDLATDPQQSHDRAADPVCAERLAQMRELLIGQLRQDGYERPLDGNRWRRWARPEFPRDPDAGLLLQDPPSLSEDLARLGPYAPTAPLDAAASQVLLQCPDPWKQ